MPESELNDQLQAFQEFEEQLSGALDDEPAEDATKSAFDPQSAVIPVGVAFLVWFGVALVLAWNAIASGSSTTGSAALGQLGDAFGVVNAAVSGLAFLALVQALGLQREQLAKQSQELEAQRRELRFQRFAMFLDHEERKASTREQKRANDVAVYTAKLALVDARLQAIHLKASSDTMARTKHYNTDGFLDALAKRPIELHDEAPGTSIFPATDQA